MDLQSFFWKVVFNLKKFRFSMSVMLFLEKTKSGEEVEVGIANEEAFTEYWLKIAHKNSLDFIIDMQVGYYINFSNLPDIIRELKLMKYAFFNEEGLNIEARDFYCSRIERILEKIEPEIDNPDVEGFVA